MCSCPPHEYQLNIHELFTVVKQLSTITDAKGTNTTKKLNSMTCIMTKLNLVHIILILFGNYLRFFNAHFVVIVPIVLCFEPVLEASVPIKAL